MKRIEISEEQLKRIEDKLEKLAEEGDTDAIKLLFDLRKQTQVDDLRKELFG